MCGFAAMLALNGQIADMTAIERMTAIITHRGPDDQGTYTSGAVGFGFRRLSILDLSPAGHQPMLNDDGQVAIVFNGEIYNFKELRQDLESLGHRFRSNSDTEVLLQAYCEWGVDCLNKLNGMWAFLIHDQRRQKLFGSRDRFGIKPLYRYHDRDRILFGSEIKAIRASGLYRGGTNWSVASSFLINNDLDQSSKSFFTGIEQVPSGTAFECDANGKMREWTYWSPDAVPSQTILDPETEFGELFEDAVRLHMRSDVPVGVSLSGGLDSTSIICAAARLRKDASAQNPLMAFSYMAKEFDESKYVADTVKQTGAQLIRLDASPEKLWSQLGRVLWYQDEPIHSMTAIVGYQLMGLVASNGVKVVLSGQGADESAAGYPSYFKDYWTTLIAKGQPQEAWSEIRRYAKHHGGSAWKLYADRLKHLTQVHLGTFGTYRNLAKIKHRQRLKNNKWFAKELTDYLPDGQEKKSSYGLDASLIRSISTHPLPLYLRIEDRNSMAHSVEARLPFLDYRLAEFLFNLPPDWKMRGHWNKFVLREAMKDRIPESVRSRVDKMGFPVPSNKWFADALYEPVMDILDSRKTRERGFYNIDNLLKGVKLHRKGEINLSTTLLAISQFELWSEMGTEANDLHRADR